MKQYLAVMFALVAPAIFAGDVVQPVFLMLPKSEEKNNAWSFELLVDQADPSKPKALVLEELTGVNMQTTPWAKALQLQADPKTPRKEVARLAGADFGKLPLVVKKDNALKFDLKALPDGSYQLDMKLRVAATDYFLIGGKDQAKKDVVLKYDAASKTWGFHVKKLVDVSGKIVIQDGDELMSGLMFDVTGTGIYQIAAVVGDGAYKVMDR